MLRKTLGAIGWIMAGLVGLAIALYAIAIAINWRDQEPSAAVGRFAKLYGDRPTVAAEDNAFIYALGYEAPLGENPYDVGSRRLSWMQQARAPESQDRTGDPLREPIERPLRSPRVQAFLDRCGDDTRECVPAFAASGPVFEEWLVSDAWLLERYRALIAYPGWQEFYSADPPTGLPSFASVVDGQRLALLQAKALAVRGDAAAVSALLGSDVRFWRNVLASADTLFSKMVAAAALRRHFEWGNLVLRTFPPGSAAHAVPAEWRIGMTDAERSMLRSLAGESVFISRQLTNMDEGLWNADSLADKVSSLPAAPLFQLQDTVNQHADYLWSVNEALNAPFERYAAAATAASALAERTAADAWSASPIYNFVGRALFAGGVADFGSYGRRIADIEGVRRTALAAVTLRDDDVAAGDIVASLSTSPLRNP